MRLHRCAGTTRGDRQRGSALLLVLMMTAVLTSLALVLMREASARARAAAVARDEVRVEELGRSGIDLALAHLSRLEPDARPDAPYVLALASGQVSVDALPEAGRADINRASPPLLAALLTGLGVAPDLARRLGGQIADWRDPQADQRADATHSADYAGRGLPPPGRRPFADPVELAFVLDMTPAIVARLLPLVTVCSGLEKIDPRIADRTMLRVLFGGDDGRAGAYLAQRDREADRPGDGLVPFPEPVRGFLETGSESHRGFRLRVTAQAGSLVRRFEGVVCGTAQNGTLRRLSWRAL